jgi:hypothetical protein
MRQDVRTLVDNTITVLLEQLGTEKGLSVGVGDEERNRSNGVSLHTNTHGKSALLWQTSKATIQVLLSLRIVAIRSDKMVGEGHGTPSSSVPPAQGGIWSPVTLKRGLFCWLVGRRRA